MRWFSFLAICLLTTSVAGQLPLTNKEIALMLRSGYSSESVVAEIQNRRVLEPLDPATKKSMVEFGASAQLIAALEGGSFIVSGSDADQAKAREAEVAAKRQEQIEQDRKLNTLLQARQAQAHVQASVAPPPGETRVLDSLKSKLVRCRDGTTSRADGSELEKKKYVALYFSAHWCGPCRKFTPQLVDYYNRVTTAHPEFEIIFISSDRSRFGWDTYLQETKMPWLAVDYDQVAGLGGIRNLGGDSIPSLLVLDSGSRIIASSYDGEKYLGPQNALATLDKIFAEPGGNAIAQAP
jgi:nucleoredoxin